MPWTDFVDEVFLINLFTRPDRLQCATKELKRFDIGFTTWAATKNDNGKLGLRDTMQQLFVYSLEMGYQRICVFEDDIFILKEDFNEIMDKCIEQLPKYFHLFYMGGYLCKNPIRKSENILQVTSIFSTHAIIYSREAMLYILQRLETLAAIDVMYTQTIQRLKKCYCSYPLLISQKEGFSDIEGRELNYDKHIQQIYALRTKGI